MNEQLTNKKKLNKQLQSKLFNNKYKLNINNDNFAVIDCKANDINTLYSSYDLNSESEINTSFSNFLIKEVSIIPLNYNLHLDITFNKEFNKKNKEKLKKSIKQHFSFKITDLKIKMKRNFIKALTLFSFSLISLIVTFLTKQNSIFFLNETFLILGWFFLWEGSNVLVYNRFNLKHKLYNYLRLYNAGITFNTKKTSN